MATSAIWSARSAVWMGGRCTSLSHRRPMAHAHGTGLIHMHNLKQPKLFTPLVLALKIWHWMCWTGDVSQRHRAFFKRQMCLCPFSCLEQDFELLLTPFCSTASSTKRNGFVFAGGPLQQRTLTTPDQQRMCTHVPIGIVWAPNTHDPSHVRLQKGCSTYKPSEAHM